MDPREITTARGSRGRSGIILLAIAAVIAATIWLSGFLTARLLG